MWVMRCLLCPTADQIGWGADLVRLQEHAMYDHGYSRVDLRTNTRRPGSWSKDHFIWTMPDGKDWLEAKKASGS